MSSEPGDVTLNQCAFDIIRTVIVTGCGSIAYGLHIAVASMALYWVLKDAQFHSRSTRIHTIFVVTLIIAGSINYFFSIANYLYETKTNSMLVFHIVPYVAALFIAFICNCLLLYRCYVVWDARLLILVIPTANLIAAMAYGSLRLSYKDNFDKYLHILVYWSLTFFQNVLLTCLISGRILWMRKRLRRLLGEKFSKSYGSNLSILVESSLLYTMISLLGTIPVLIIRYGNSKATDYAFGPLLVQSECVASELIILRLTMNRAVPRQWSTTARSADPETDIDHSILGSRIPE